MFKTLSFCTLFSLFLVAVLHQNAAAATSCDTALVEPMIENGALWMDNNGVFINAHGGGFLLHDSVYYWFGEHKIAGTQGNAAHVGVHVYSSPDLLHWQDRGIALAVDSVNDHSLIAKGCILERPKVIYNAQTRQFVMWFHLERKGQGYSSALSGVAVADAPCGPYTFVRAERANAGKKALNHPTVTDEKSVYLRDLKGGQMQRDMTLFVDADATAYHIFASEENQTLHIAELDSTYTAHSGRYVRAFVGRFMEAPAVFRRDGKYYLIASGCTGWSPNAARSAVADSILGPWRELKNPCVGTGAERTFGGQSTYILEHPRKKGTFILMCDLWRPQNAIDGRYMWLPITFEGEQPVVRYREKWHLNDVK